MIIDYAKIAMKNIRKKKLRSWLTIVGIIISISVVFLLISLSLGLRGAISEQFKILGTDKLFILPKGQAGGPGSGGVVELTTWDVEVVEKVLGVKDISYATVGNAKLESNNKIRFFYVIGLPLDKMGLYTKSTNMKMDEGRELKEGDRGVAMIGSDYKYGNLFGKPIQVGESILVNDRRFKVVGIIEPIGNPSDDKNVLIPIDDFKELFNSGERVDQIIVQVENEKETGDISARIEKKLLKARNLDEKTKDFTIITPEELLASFDIILNIVTAFLVGVAAISLLVGGVGIANTMYTSVLERTREIGTMKAVGAKNSAILQIFLIESGFIGFIGGTLGILTGFGISKLIEFIAINYLHTTLLKAASPFYLIFGCLAFSFLIGIISGTFPAFQASKLKPVEALRYE